jgi:hypothetical protein
VVSEAASLLHAAVNASAFHLLDLEHDEPVVEQQRVAGDDIVREIAVRAAHGMLVAAVRVHCDVQ